MNKIIIDTKSRVLATIILSTLVVVAVPSITNAYTLNRQLDLKATGDDVSAVQTYLAKDSSLYPQGLVTGYFGSMTASAVSKYQTRNGFEAVGRVGPLTLASLNRAMAAIGNNSMSNGLASPAIYNTSVNTGRNSVNIGWSTDQLAEGLVFYSTSPLQTTEHLNSVDVSGNMATADYVFRSSQNVGIPNLQPNTTYYYMIYVTNQNGGVSVTWPATFQTTN